MKQFIKDQDSTNETLLMHQVARQFRTCFDRRALPKGLTRSQWRVLCILRRNSGIHQTQLADLLEVEPITLARQLDRMQTARLIERKADPDDRRANMLYMTEKGQKIMGKMLPLSLDIRKSALEGFSAKEHGKLIEYLTRIKNNIADMLAEGMDTHHAPTRK